MNNYLIELSVIHVVLVSAYWFFLRKERQYEKLRFYLLASTVLALTVPLLKLPKLLFSSRDPIDAVPENIVQLDAMAISYGEENFQTYDNLFIWVYLSGSIFFLGKFLFGVLSLVWLARGSRRENFNGLYIRKARNIKGSFTFFNWIFLSDEIDKDQQDYNTILKHEKAHVSLGHTYDLVFFEVFKVCFWWLPTAWYIRKEIRAIHEYQADLSALRSCDVDRYSSILIRSTLKSNGLNIPAANRQSRRQAGLASSFHDSLILKRLIAMKQQAKNVSPWKLGGLSALCVLLVTVFACSEEPTSDTQAIDTETKKIEGGKFTVVERQPEFEGGISAFRKYIMNEVRYPLEARQKGVEGQVDVQFVIGKDGSISQVKAIKGIDAACDSEAERVVESMPPFTPGTQNGKPVFVRMMVPIVFKLNKGKVNPDNSTQGIIVIGEVQQVPDKFKVDADFSNGEWSGTVYDENGEGLPGVNIVVVGTTNGTVSSLDGTFKLKADQGKDLSISFIGYETLRLKGR